MLYALICKASACQESQMGSMAVILRLRVFLSRKDIVNVKARALRRGILAKKLSKIAGDWGKESAVRWAEDSNFTRFLTIAYLNVTS